MKVKDLIHSLESLEENSNVVLNVYSQTNDSNFVGSNVLSVCACESNNTVVIIAE